MSYCSAQIISSPDKQFAIISNSNRVNPRMTSAGLLSKSMISSCSERSNKSHLCLSGACIQYSIPNFVSRFIHTRECKRFTVSPSYVDTIVSVECDIPHACLHSQTFTEFCPFPSPCRGNLCNKWSNCSIRGIIQFITEMYVVLNEGLILVNISCFQLPCHED